MKEIIFTGFFSLLTLISFHTEARALGEWEDQMTFKDFTFLRPHFLPNDRLCSLFISPVKEKNDVVVTSFELICPNWKIKEDESYLVQSSDAKQMKEKLNQERGMMETQILANITKSFLEKIDFNRFFRDETQFRLVSCNKAEDPAWSCIFYRD